MICVFASYIAIVTGPGTLKKDQNIHVEASAKQSASQEADAVVIFQHSNYTLLLPQNDTMLWQHRIYLWKRTAPFCKDNTNRGSSTFCSFFAAYYNQQHSRSRRISLFSAICKNASLDKSHLRNKFYWYQILMILLSIMFLQQPFPFKVEISILSISPVYKK